MVSYLTPQEKKAVNKFKKQVLQTLGQEVISFLLFGSRARGEGTEDSDVDILVLLKKWDRQDHDKVIDIASDLFLEFEINISPLVMSQVQFQELNERELLLAREIKADGYPI